MKKNWLLAVCCVFALAGCKGNSEESVEDKLERLGDKLEQTVEGSHSDDAVESDYEEESDAVSSSSSDWDSALDESEEYVDEYIKFYKKAMEGDMSAMSEYASLLEKAQSMYDKLDGAQGEMTASQLARLNKIQMKMVNAMQ